MQSISECSGTVGWMKRRDERKYVQKIPTPRFLIWGTMPNRVGVVVEVMEVIVVAVETVVVAAAAAVLVIHCMSKIVSDCFFLFFLLQLLNKFPSHLAYSFNYECLTEWHRNFATILVPISTNLFHTCGSFFVLKFLQTVR